MEFPFGGHHHSHHHHHHHHHRNEEEEEEEYPPPLPSYRNHHHQPNTPPPPNFGGTTIESHQHYGPPPPNYMYQQEVMYERPPQPDFTGYYSSEIPSGPGVYSSSSSSVQHVSSHDFNHHQQRFEPEDPSEFRHETHQHHSLQHHHNPNDHTPPTSFVHHHTHETGFGGNELFINNNNVPTVRVYSKAEPGYSLTIRDGRVILAPSNPTDVFQHWIKDEKYSIRVKDEEGFPSFSLINKATGQSIKHSIGATHPVQLRPYNPDDLDESVLWTESRDLGDGFRTIRMVNNIRLNLDAFHGDKNHGGVHDGTTIVLWEWKKGDNQRWRIVRYCKSFDTPIKKGS